MNFGIVTDFYGCRIPLEEALQRLAKLGFRDLEIPGWHWTAGQDPAHFMTGNPRRIENVKKMLADLGLNVQQFHSSLPLAVDSEEKRKNWNDLIKQTIELAAELGAGALVIHIGGRHEEAKGLSREEVFERNAKSLAELVKYTENTPLKLAIENLMSDTHLLGCKIAELKELIAAVGSENMGICLDTGHANVDGLDVAGAIEECGDLLIATHIQETCPGNDIHAMPFSIRRVKSSMDWFKIFDTFRKVHYPYPLIGECANTTGELPVALADQYLKAQKELIDAVLRGDFSPDK